MYNKPWYILASFRFFFFFFFLLLSLHSVQYMGIEKWKSGKNGKELETIIMWRMSGGHEVDIGEGPHSNNVWDFSIERSITWQNLRWSQDWEHSTWTVKKQKTTRPQVYCVRIWALSLPPYLPMSTSYPPDIIHGKYSQTFVLYHVLYWPWTE